jgi:hypothetical protein
MRKAVLLLVLIGAPPTSGCALSDLLFDIFGDAYSAGGSTDAERQVHYEDRVRAMDEPSRIPGTSTRPF